MMEKRERLERAFAGETVDRIPVALWRHWPGDDQRTADFARAVVDFQIMYDWDFVKVTPASTAYVLDYGAKDYWQGALSGDRTCTKYAIQRSLDWTELRPLDPMRGEYGKHLEVLRLITENFPGEAVPVITTIYSPLSQAVRLAGADQTIRNLRTHTDRLRTGLNAITETTLRFIDALKRLPIAGIYYITEHADYTVLSEEEYRGLAAPYDLKILTALPSRWWLNILYVAGSAPMLNAVSAYPVPAIHWQDIDSNIDLEKGKTVFSRTLMGGLSAGKHLHDTTPAAIKDAARSAINAMDGRRFILSSGGATLVTTPLSNLRAAREVVDAMGKV